MTNYRFTPEAEEDLFEIWRYIARDSVAGANRVESAVYDACVFLAQEPRSGSPRQHVTALPVHFWTVQQYPNYVVVYRPKTQPLEIIRVLHGTRDLKRLLNPERSLTACYPLEVGSNEKTQRLALDDYLLPLPDRIQPLGGVDVPVQKSNRPSG